jgi:hypothetical protein
MKDDFLEEDLVQAMIILNQKLQPVKLLSGLVTNEAASFQLTLYKIAPANY